MYRIIWLVSAIIVLVSIFLTYVYEDSLISIMGRDMPKFFDVFGNPSWENLAIPFSFIGFVLILLAGIFCLIFSIGAYSGSKLWNAPTGIRIWNAAILGLIGVLLLSLPVLVYRNGSLYQITSFMGTQYWPSFEGFGIGYFLTWIGVLLSFVAGSLVLKNKPASLETQKKT